MRKVLHVGCGIATIDKMPPGFRDGTWQEVRFDIDPDVGPDIVGTITDMAGVADGSVDAVYSSHNIEHVYAYEVQGVLAEFRRVLKPDGFAVITCPDIETVARHIAQGRLAEPLYQSPSGPITPLDILYGHGDSLAQGFHYMAHKTGFSARTLSDHVKRAGFAILASRSRPASLDVWLIASKAAVSEEEIRAMMASYCRA